MVATTPEVPKLKVAQAAQFFDKSIAWMRWIEKRPGLLVKEDGTPIEIERTTPRRAKKGFRLYTHQNIADMADALHRAGKLDDAQYAAVKTRITGFL